MKRLLFTIFAFAITIATFATTTVRYQQGANVTKDGTECKTFDFYMDNQDDLYSYQYYFYLTGVSVSDIVDCTSALDDRFTFSFQKTSSKGDATIMCYGYTSGYTPISITSGKIFTLYVNATATGSIKLDGFGYNTDLQKETLNTVTVNLDEAVSGTVNVDNITLNRSKLSLEQGETATLTATVSPDDAENKVVSWSSSNESVATVSTSGVVTAKAIGTATITCAATDGSGIKATCAVTVTKASPVSATTISYEQGANVTKDGTECKTFDFYIDNQGDIYSYQYYFYLTGVSESDLIDCTSALDSRFTFSFQKTSSQGDAVLMCMGYTSAYQPISIPSGKIFTLYVNAAATGSLKLEGFGYNTSLEKETLNTITVNLDEVVIDTADTDISTLANAIYASNTEASIGKTFSLPIQMKNNFDVTGFQFDLVLPEGITVTKDEDDFLNIALSTARTTAKKTDTFSSTERSDGSIRVICSSTKNYAFSGTDGEVATIELNIPETMEAGDYPIILKNIEMSDASGNPTKVDYVKSTLTLSNYKPGDANGDGNVSISDFSAIVSYLLDSTPASFVEKAADVNADNNISVSDLSALVNIILSDDGTSPAKAKANTNGSASMDLSFTSYNNNEATATLNLFNNVPVNGYQFDIVLSDGVSIKDITLNNARTNAKAMNCFTYTTLENGNVRVICASTSNAAFEGNEGAVANITFAINGNAVAAPINVINAEATSYGKAIEISDFTKYLNSEVTGISSVRSAESIVHSYYNLNGQCVNGNTKGIVIVNGKKIVK